MCARYLIGVVGLLAFSGMPTEAGALAYDVDYATFADLHGSSTRSYAEIYFRVDRWSLAEHLERGERSFGFVQATPDTFVVGFAATLAVVSAEGDSVERRDLTVSQPIPEQCSGTAFDDLYTSVGLYLAPGSYTLATQVRDLYEDTSAFHEMPFIVQDFAGEEPKLSDIELALAVGQDTSGSRFAKHGLSVLPNARRVFGFGAPIFYFYAEIYHLDESAVYRTTATFIDSAGDTTRTLGPFDVAADGPTSVQVKGANVMGWRDGVYRLVLSLIGPDGVVLSKRIKEMIVNRVPTITQPTIDKFKRDVAWIAKHDEMTEFDRLSPEGKAQFIQDFWGKRDPTPGTVVNEAKEEHYRRLAFADERFRELGMPGRSSDQGRVYVQYGAPDDVERHASTEAGRPYQIWQYRHVEGGVMFVFADFSGSGRLTLIHSTAKDEIRNDRWRQVVEPYEGTFQRRARLRDEMDSGGRDR